MSRPADLVPDYLRLDEREDVLTSLDLCSMPAPELTHKPVFWKWMIIGAHNALYGALVCALSGTAGVGALEPKSAAKMLDYLERDQGDYPKEFSADYGTLLKWAQDKTKMSYLDGEPMVLASEEAKDLAKLNDLPRNLIHFTPKGWSIEIVGLPRITMAAIGRVRMLMLQHPAVRMHLSPAQETQLNAHIDLIERHLTA